MAPCVCSMAECSTTAAGIRWGCSENGWWCGFGLLRDSDARRIECQGKTRTGFSAETVGADRLQRGFGNLTNQQKCLREMEIKKRGSQRSSKGPTDWFTVSVRIDPLFEAPEPARVRGASVTFEPGARTAWHSHPLGQTLIVTSGLGWTQCWGGRKEEIR